MSGAMEAMPSAMLLPALLIAVSLLGSAVLIIGFFVRYWMNAQEKKDDSQDRAIDGIRQDISSFKAMLPREYVLRDDFIREISGLHYKMDRVARDVANISKLLAKLLGGKEEDDTSQ